MRGSWWQWLSAVLAIICGLAFGWVAGTGVAQAASAATVPVPAVKEARVFESATGDGARRPARGLQGRLPGAMPCCAAPPDNPQLRCWANHSNMRFQASSASSLR
jgi:hypothetical protein